MHSSYTLIVRFKLDKGRAPEHQIELLQKLREEFGHEDYMINPAAFRGVKHKGKTSGDFFINEDVFAKIVCAIGTYSDIARLCGVTPPCISYWRECGMIPLAQVKRIIDAANHKLGEKRFKYKDLLPTWLYD